MAISFQVTFDCADPARVGTFWAAALRYEEQAPPPEGYATWSAFLEALGVPEDQRNSASAVVDPDDAGPRFFFLRVPEAKSVKNRVHLEVNIGGRPSVPLDERRRRVGAEVERLVGFDATKIRTHDKDDEHWVVMYDPEGNEFCLQ